MIEKGQDPKEMLIKICEVVIIYISHHVCTGRIDSKDARLY